MLALTAPIILTPLITYLKPENYDFEKFKELQQVDDSGFDVKAQTEGVAVKTAQERTEAELVNLQGIEKELYVARNYALGAALFIAISLTILWPIPMYGTSYVFSKPFFTGWIVVTFIWAFFGAIVVTLLPIVESRREIYLFFRAVITRRSASG
ncbi:hypothetical protein NW754_007704 [Fusarium falciforme]|nr:hypothetical protein NW754_007704 [Fusarium falciforme]